MAEDEKMKTTISMVILSGGKDAEIELSDDVSKQISLLLWSAKEISETVPQSKLGFGGYCVNWKSEDHSVLRMVAHEGIISLHCRVPIYLKDTVGMEDFLTKLFNSLTQT